VTLQEVKQYRRQGFTFGLFIGSREWLTVLGSFFRLPDLRATREEAELDMAAFQAMRTADGNRVPNLEVAEVEMVRHSGVSGGWAFRVVRGEAEQ
jgi:hypothetical protein